MLGGLTNLLPESYLSVYDNIELIIRIILAGVLGALIGLERGKRLKEAGMRTHCIIAMAAATFMIVSKYAFGDCIAVSGIEGADPARIAAGVVTGITFLGAGVIFRNKDTGIRGLTTAAGMWGTAAVGLTVGSGLYVVGIALSVLVLLSQLLLHKFRFGNDALYVQTLIATVPGDFDLKTSVEKLAESHDGHIEEISIKRVEQSMELTIVVRCRTRITHEEVMDFMLAHKEIQSIHL